MNLDAELQIAEKHRGYLESVGRYEYARRWPRIRYYHFTGQRAKMLMEMSALFLRAPLKMTCHLLESGPKRLLHEQKMRRLAQR